MAFGQFRVGAFDALLRSAGVPIDGISLQADAPAGVVIQFKETATPEQIAWAENAKATFDWRRRKPLTRNQIQAALANLTTGQQNAILRHAVCFLLRQNTSEAADIANVLGLALPVDEADPTEPVPTP
jgi:hypothetical protein